jgi:hypothetical protein
VDQPRSALRGEECGRNADIGADVEHHVALANLDAVPDVHPLSNDLGELKQKLGRIVVVQQPTQLRDAARS